MNKKITKQKEIWRKLSWVWQKYITPPARPCRSLIKNWEKVVNQISQRVKSPKALILGATPELRDLVLKYNFESIAYDINPNMLEAMDKVMKFKNHPKNKKIVGSWLKMNFKENSFDLILGHWSIGQLFSQKEAGKLLNKLMIFLKPDGFLLITELTREKKKPEIKGKDWQKWFKRYKEKRISETELHNFLKYLSDWNFYPESPSLLGTLSIYEKIKQLSKKDKDIKKFYFWWEKVLNGQDKKDLIFLRKDFRKLLKKYFELLPIKQCRDYLFCRYTLSYLGKPKKIR